MMQTTNPDRSLDTVSRSQTALSSRTSFGERKPTNAREAAKQFEGLLIRQLVQVLRSSTSGSGLFSQKMPGGQMYGHFFDQALSSHLVDAGGLGMSSMIAATLGEPSQESGGVTTAPIRSRVHSTWSEVLTSHGARIDGATGQLQRAATRMMRSASVDRWSKEGQLDEHLLSSRVATEEVGGVAKFNVRDANGYQGYNKCNLFALEISRRAGFQVPLVERGRGWGFPSSNALTRDAQDGVLRKDWASVVTGVDADTMDRRIVSGQSAFMLTGSAEEGRSGHMAVVERVHRIDYNSNGDISRIVFDGWEARAENGAEHLKKRTWNVGNRVGGNLARNGFHQVEIIELKRSKQNATEEVKLAESTKASKNDVSVSSFREARPNSSVEGQTP